MADLATLQSMLANNPDIETAAKTLIDSIVYELQAAKNDPAMVQTLADQLRDSADNLAKAIVANTIEPLPPEPVPTPPEPIPPSPPAALETEDDEDEDDEDYGEAVSLPKPKPARHKPTPKKRR